MIKTWKGKWSDLILVLVYFMLYSVGIHVLSSVRLAIRHNVPIMEQIKDPSNVFLSFALLFFFMSPVWVYFRKVPKKLIIDYTNSELFIHKKRRVLKYNMDKIRYAKRVTTFFYILEIHATFETSRNGEIEKLASSIIVPNWGLSWNKKTMNEIVKELDDLKVQEILDRPKLPISEYFYN